MHRPHAVRPRATLGVASLALSLLAPAAALAQVDPGGGVGGGPLSGTLTVTVVDQASGAPVAGAFCQVGTSPGVPFAGNLKTTNGSGQAVFTNAALAGPQTVTVGKDGYFYLTIFGVNAAVMILPIGVEGYEVPKALYQGDLTGMTPVSNDGLFDVAVVLPALSIDDLTTLGNFGQFAPMVVENFPSGPTQVPGNIYMPTQIELLFFVFQRKPYYIWLADQTTQDLYAFYGRISIASLLDNLGADKPDYLGIIQDFNMRKAGIAEGVVVNGPGTRNFALTNNVTFNLRMNVSNTLPGYDVFLFAAADLDSLSGLGRLVPCGFDGATGGQSASLLLSTINTGGSFTGMNYVAGAVESDTTLGLANSFVSDRRGLDPGDTAVASTFFLPPTPSVSGSGTDFSWTSVQNPGVSPAPDLHFAEVSLVKTIPDTNPGADPADTLDIPTLQWRFVASGSATSFTVPRIGPNVMPGIPDPADTPDQDRLDWTVTGIALELEPAFNYDDWDFRDRGLKGTHLAWNTQTFIPFPSSLWTGVPWGDGAARGIALDEPAPSPFRGATEIAFAVPDGARSARLAVYDVAGRRVRTLVDGAVAEGRGRVAWDGRDDSGAPVAAGAYVLRLEAGGRSVSRKVTRLP